MSELSPLLSVLVSAAIITLSAFFVAVEFALVAARRYRLEESAVSSVAARAAVRSAREISLLLAGSQLGITLCTLALGAITKPAVHHALTPLFAATGLPEGTASAAAFVLALFVVTFLHLVIGEMAPKSWAIAHPEQSAILLALPMRAFMWCTRPVLVVLNGIANRVLRTLGVEPVDEVARGRNRDDIQQLLRHSASVGTLDAEHADRLTVALSLDSRSLGEIVRPMHELVSVGPSDTAADVRTASLSSGHLRLVVVAGSRVLGTVHVRDTLAVNPNTPVRSLLEPVRFLSEDVSVYAALRAMRTDGTQLTLVRSGPSLLGFVTLQDLLDELLPGDAGTASAEAEQASTANVGSGTE